jgi:hypothetical protein
VPQKSRWRFFLASEKGRYKAGFAKRRREWRKYRVRLIKLGLKPITSNELDVLRFQALSLSHADFAEWLGIEESAAAELKKGLNLPGHRHPPEDKHWDLVELGGAPDIAIALMCGYPEEEVRAAREYRRLPTFEHFYSNREVAEWVADVIEMFAQIITDVPLGFRTAAMAYAENLRRHDGIDLHTPVPYCTDKVREKIRGLLGLTAEESMGFDGARAGSHHRSEVRRRRSGHSRYGVHRVGYPTTRGTRNSGFFTRGLEFSPPDQSAEVAEGADGVHAGRPDRGAAAARAGDGAPRARAHGGDAGAGLLDDPDSYDPALDPVEDRDAARDALAVGDFGWEQWGIDTTGIDVALEDIDADDDEGSE